MLKLSESFVIKLNLVVFTLSTIEILFYFLVTRFFTSKNVYFSHEKKREKVISTTVEVTKFKRDLTQKP